VAYKPGLHIIAEIRCSDAELLKKAVEAKTFFLSLCDKMEMHCLGDVFHSFKGGGGFTGVICLTESHLSLHTWPEYGLITFDVFLSNYTRENDTRARAILQETLQYFKTIDYTSREVRR
jgi:S-adenosylmethionine decarboxylase